ncbi:MAG: GNAT family N-acetyltransferase [Candidatus Bathyarchaeota archaeon]|nr:GNAT family N-acetyltransferase [Candidatus Bathyarchaeota archaeon]
MVIIRQLKFNEWIRPLQLSAQILEHTPQPEKTLLQLKLPLSLLVMKIYDHETIYVAEEANQIIGICLAQIQEKQLIIEGTTVTEKHRRKGISNKLKNAVENKAIQLGATTAITKIEPHNKPAITMAQKQGYTKTDTEKMYKKQLVATA